MLLDGHRVGFSVGGRGVPLMFFHGIGMNRHAYLRLLNRLPQLGFMVIAVDAPGHGESVPLGRGERTFDNHIGAASRLMTALGVRRAVLVGHSMGGRTAAGLAACEPHKAMSTVLIGPALGSSFDAMALRIKSPVSFLGGLTAALADFVVDRVGLQHFDHLRHTTLLGRSMARTLAHPDRFLTTARAIAQSEHSTDTLSQLASEGVPVAIVHGEKDMVIPLESAVEAAALSRATLITLPRAYHSWVLSTPWTFAEIMRQLLSEHRLGSEIDRALAREAARSARSNVDTRLYAPHAPVLDMAPPLRILGAAAPSNRRLYHDFTIWHADKVSRNGGR